MGDAGMGMLPFMALHCLVGDDAIGFRFLLQSALETAGFERVTLCEQWGDVVQATEADPPDAILVDLLMPTLDREALTRTRAAAPAAVLAVISSYGREDAAREVDGVDGIDLVFSKRERTAEIAATLMARVRAR